MNNLVQRTLVGAVGIPIAVSLIWLGGWWFSLAIIFITTIGLWEFYRLAAAKQSAANVPVGLTWSVILQLSFVMALESTGQSGLNFIGVALMVFVAGVVATLAAELWRGRENAIVNTGLTITGVSYVTVCLSTLLFLRASPDPTLAGSVGDRGETLVLVVFVSVWSTDTAAYFFGRWFGKHLLFPRVSPKKTWEGAIGGGITSIVVFSAMSAAMMPLFPLEHSIACGAIIGSIGQIGDLAESLLKRDATIKDSSHIIPGHGGVLDRFDSMLFASPLILIYLTIVSMVKDMVH